MIYVVSLFAFILDYLTKMWVVSHLTFGIPQEICPFFNLLLVGNKGISFSMFTSETTTGTWTLIIMASLICMLLIHTIQQEKDTLSRFALALVLGGAIGNIWDRIQYGAVVDFLDFYYQNHHFPAFNLADTFICAGMGLLVLRMLKKEKKHV